MLKCLDPGTGEQSLHNKKPPASQMAKSQRGPYTFTSTQIQIGKMSSDQNSGCLLYIGDNIVHLEPK